jgi:iron complex outermembrane receptor protein
MRIPLRSFLAGRLQGSAGPARFLIVALGLGLWLAVPAAQGAQEPPRAVADQTAEVKAGDASLAGVVKDPHQAAVTGALVKLANQQTKKVYNAHTDSQGHYEFTGLPAGEYKLEVAARGFSVAQVASLKVEAGARATQDIALELGKTRQAVEVSALALETDVKTMTPAALLTLPEGVKGDSIVFTAQDIEALHPTSLLDVLQQVPGMEITFQGRQHMNFASMRGGNFQVILDGVYLSQTDRLLATLPVQSVESMTVVLDSTALSIGPLSSYHAFGSGTSGVGNQGFIVIKTKRSATPDVGIVSSGGNFGSAMGQVYLGNKSGNWDYRGAYTYDTTEGRGGWNMQSRNGSAMFHGGYTSGKTNMDFLYYGTRGMRNMEYGLVEMPAGATCQYGSGPNKGKNYLAPDGTLCQSTMNLDKMDGDLFAMNLSHLWNDNNRTVIQYGFDRLDIIGGGSKQPSTEGDFDLKHTLRIKRQTITAGTQVMRYIAPLGAAPSASSWVSRADDLLASWYLQDEVPLVRNKLVLDGGVRGDKLHNSFSTASKSKVDTWAPQFMSVALGLTYKATSAVTFTTRYGMVQSAPASNLVVAPYSASLPNQTQHRGEVGSQIKVKPYFNPHVALYFYNTKNGTSSASNCTNPNTGQKNVSSWITPTGVEIDCVTLAGTVKTAGTEFGFGGRVNKRFTYDAGYGFVGTNNNSNNNNMSHNFVNARLSYRQSGWFGNFSMVYVGPKRASTSPLGVIYYQLGDYTRFDANVGRDVMLFDRQMTLTLFGRNLGDNLYATRYVTGAYRDPGLQYGIQLAYRFLPKGEQKH